jgi:isoleucyl-tRNA synthetase
LTTSPQEFLPDGCPKGRDHALRKDSDILDVWFDSGVSHEAVLRPRADADLQWPASLYLEGSDQHRGWFQVSLITAAALSGRAPYEQVLTHGFVVDGDGRKMSKSLGNVIAPNEVIQKFGAEMLRLWVVASDYSEDVRISEPILAQMAEAYRKLRNTFRYLLGNLSDFSPARDRQPPETMPEFDQWALQRAQRLLDAVTEAYAAYHFHHAFRAIYQFCVLDLSSCYLDALKDRLYTDAASGSARRCAQTALYDILVGLLRMLAPMLPMTTEEVWQVMRTAGTVEAVSVHLAEWPVRLAAPREAAFVQRWETFLAVRAVVMKALEEQRSAQVIGSPLEAQVSLVASDPQLARVCEQHRDALAELFVVSEVRVLASGEGGGTAVQGLAQVRVTRADGAKCQRCWNYRPTVGQSSRHPQLCNRCVIVVQQREST